MFDLDHSTLDLAKVSINYETLLMEMLKGCDTWSAVKARFPADNLIAGKIFEIFAKCFFLLDPKTSDNYQHVWLYSEIPLAVRTKLNLGPVEHGVDLILESQDEQYTAVQCKFRFDETGKLGWTKDKLGNLFGFANNAEHYIIFTNANDIDSVSKTRSKTLLLIRIQELMAISPNTIERMHNFLKSKQISPAEKFKPRPHQEAAIEMALTYFQTQTRGQIILPCGAGKTLTALWLKEALKVQRTIVLLPSLALLRQIKDDWLSQRRTKFNYICVCSDTDIDSDSDDAQIIHTYEIDARVISSAENIQQYLSGQQHGEVVIFSTYQSLQKVIEASKQLNFRFDLAICDEAHRTASLKSSLFSQVHKDANIAISKRLYLTATPRVASKATKSILTAENEPLYDMSNPEIFGQEIFRLSFAQAIENKILVDYKIVAMGISDEEVRDFVKDRHYISGKESADEIANNVALDKVMNATAAKHAVTFHARVRSARNFSVRHARLFSYFSSFVSGEQPMSLRTSILRDFSISSQGVVSNSRCLTEGVDIPTIDLVFFCDPKNSKIDIVQAAGRALRRDSSGQKQLGYIVIPVFHNSKDSFESTLESSHFHRLIQIIRSLAEHDERLHEEINQIAYAKTKRGLSRIEISGFSDHEHSILRIANFEERLRNSIFEQIIEKSSTNWESQYLALVDWMSEHHDYPKQKENNQLYTWVSIQRLKKKKGELSNTQISKLDKLNFIWDLQAAIWDEKYELLKQFRETNIYEPSLDDDKELYTWLQTQKSQLRRGVLSAERHQKIEQLAFQGSVNDKNWEDNFQALLKFRATYPDRWPKQRGSEGVEQQLSIWLLRIRREYKQEILPQSKIERLKAIGFPFLPEDTLWQIQFDRAKQWLANSGKFPKSNEASNVGKAIYRWLSKQQADLENDRIPTDRLRKLDSISFKEFSIPVPNAPAWGDRFEQLSRYMQNHGSAPSYSPREDPETNKLAIWLSKQRENFRLDKLPNASVSKLEKIGVILDTRKLRDEKWEKMFQELRRFRAENPDRWPSYKKAAEKALAAWCNAMKSWHNGHLRKYGKFPQERKDKLASIGFSWQAGNERWLRRYEELRRQLANGDLAYESASGKQSPLSKWIYNNRKAYKKGKLDAEKIEMLESLGIKVRSD